MNTEERSRFETLIAFLETLEPEKFEFSAVVSEYDLATHCGTVCCAIGWTPKLFPGLASWSLGRNVRLLSTGELGYPAVAAALFGLDEEVCEDLFAPNCQWRVHKELENCDYDATPQEVAAMLRQFLALMDSGELTTEGVKP